MHSARWIPQASPAAVLVLLVAGVGAAGQDSARDGLTQVVPVRYSFSRDTIRHPDETDENPIYADPRLQKLTDGQWDTSARRVVWCCKGWQDGPVLDLRFVFGQPLDLRRVVVHSLRRRAYAVQRIQVFGRGDDGETLLGDETLNQSWAYPPTADMPQTKMMALAAACGPGVVTEARVRIHLISYLGLSEVEFFGVPAQAPAAPGPEAYQLPPPSADKTFGVRSGDLNGDGHEDFLLENSQVAYVVEPRWGGVVNVALNKRTGVNLVKPNAKGTWGGLFADRMYATARTDFFGQSYDGEVVDASADKAVVRVRGCGRSGQYVNITFEKTFTLEPDCVALRVDYRVLNGQDNVVAVNDGVWVLNGLGSAKEATRVFWAGEDGPRELRQLSTQYVYEPRRGWLGMVAESGSGIALLCEYRRTAGFLFWRSGDFATVEFKMGQYPIEAGGALSMTAWAVPFDGIGTPHGASAHMVGSLDLLPASDAPPERVGFAVVPSRGGSFGLIVEARRVPDRQWQTQHTMVRTLEPVPVHLTAPLRLGGPGTWEVRVRATVDDRDVFSMERATVVGEGSGTYSMAPECERFLPESAEDRGGRTDYHSLDYPTAHVPWAKKWAGGRPSVLFLPRRRAGIREAVELAQRFEMDLHTSYLPRSMDESCLYDLADFAGRLNAPQLVKALKGVLAEQRFDAIVVPGDLWKDLRPDVLSLILDQVRAGSGLVLLAPEYTPPDLAGVVELSEPEADVRRFRSDWRRTAEHFITDGVPFDVLPGTLALPYRLGGDQLAAVGDQPLLGIGALGKGRVAVASWVVAGLQRNGYHQTYGGVGLLPNMLALGSSFSCDFHYWEYQMSLLMRMVYWAAGRDTTIRGGIAIDGVTPTGSGRAVVRLRDVSGQSRRARLTWTLRDRFSRPIDEGSVEAVALGADDASAPIDLRNAVLDGPVFLEVIALVDGKTAWWGTGVAQVSAPVRVERVEMADHVWKRQDALTGSVHLSGEPAGATVVIEGIDAHARVFARQQLEGRTELAFRLPLRDSLGLSGRAVARVLAGGRTVSEHRRPFVIHGAPDATRMQVAFGWPWVSPEGHRRFLHRRYYDRLRYLGATSVRTHHVTPFEWFEARNLGLGTLKSGANAGIGGKHPDTRTSGKGKWGLIRKPCLSEPGFREKLASASSQATAFEDAGVVYRGLGDELNSISNWDGCFSENCQVRFREWLRAQYGDVQALNRVWQASHDSWDTVVAMTLDEARAGPSLAPWVDHRLFNNWNWAQSMAAALEGLRASSPDIRLGFSGTQETKAWNAYDWWQICKSVSAVAAYAGEQVVQRRSFSADMHSMTWIGYTSSFDDLRVRVLTGLLDGDRGFSVFSGRFMIDPDYTIPERGEWLRNALGIVSGGRAEVIMGSQVDAGPVAFHYSPPSVCVDEALGTTALRGAETKGMRQLLLDRSADYDYVAYAQLEDGEVRSRDGRAYRLVVLPASTAMSDRECEVLRKWVVAGGVLVGGFGTATFSEHGARRDTGALDDVFGLRRQGSRVRSGTVRVTAAGRAHGVVFDGFDVTAEALEVGIAADSARVVGWAAGEGSRQPAVLVNRYGAGVAVYMAADVVSTYGVWGATRALAARKAAAQGMDRFMASMLDAAGIEPRPVPMTEAGERLACTRVVFRRDGPLRLLGVLRDSREAANLDPKPQVATLRFGRKYHVYDLVTRTYAGQTDMYQETFTPTTHRVLALLPYAVHGLDLGVVEGDSARRGTAVTVRVEVQAEAEEWVDHRVGVVVVRPDGEPATCYDDLLVVRGGTATLRLPLALNAPLGTWRVSVAEAISNVRATAAFTVRE